MKEIIDFITELKKQKDTDLVTNPYLENGVAGNLEHYLVAMKKLQGKRVLLVGEAPGHQGCRITGIPFTSGKVFEKISHPLLKTIKDNLVLNSIQAEPTATIVWNYLSTKNDTPLFWNSYPYHPHPKNILNKNRAPTSEEIEQGVYFLKKIVDIYQPTVIAGIGYSGVECAERAFPNIKIEYIRHPSFGGKADFIEGMNKIIL
jgi:uracil-DNA glycosylase